MDDLVGIRTRCNDINCDILGRVLSQQLYIWPDLDNLIAQAVSA